MDSSRKAVRYFFAVAVGFALLVFCADLFAAQNAPNQSASDMANVMSGINVNIKTIVQSLLAPGNSYHNAAGILFKFLSFMLLFFFIVRFMNTGFDLEDLVGVLVTIAAVQVLMGWFLPLTAAVWEVFHGLAGQVQTTAFGTSDSSYIFEWLFWVWGRVEYDSGFLSFLTEMAAAVLIALTRFISMIMLALVWIATVWAWWGYFVSVLIGYLTIPFLLLQSTRGVFFAWLRFFIGFCLFLLLSRIVLVVYATAIATFMQLPIGVGNPLPSTMPTLSYDSGDMTTITNLFVMVVLGIGAMLSIGTWSSSLAGSAVGGGVNFMALARIRGGKK